MTLCSAAAPECSTSWVVANRTNCRRRRRAIPSAVGGAGSSRSVVTRELSETGRVVPGPVPQVAVRSGVFGPRFEVGGGRKHVARLHVVDELPPDDLGSPLALDAGAEGSSHFSKDSVIDGILMVEIVSTGRASRSRTRPGQRPQCPDYGGLSARKADCLPNRPPPVGCG